MPDIPQLALQIYFLTLLGAFDEATFVALLSSSISVILSVVDIWSAKQLVIVMDNASKQVSENSIELLILSTHEIEAKKHVLLTKPRALAQAIGKMLIVDARTVEIYQLMAAEEGIKVGFTVYSVDYTVDDMLDDLGDADKVKELQLLISNYWQLKQYPQITGAHAGQRVQYKSTGGAGGQEQDMLELDTHLSIASNTETMVNALHPSSDQLKKQSHHIPLHRMRTLQRHQMKAMDPQLAAKELEGFSLLPLDEEAPSEDDRDSDVDLEAEEWHDYVTALHGYALLQRHRYEMHAMSNERPLALPTTNETAGGDDAATWRQHAEAVQRLLRQRHELVMAQQGDGRSEGAGHDIDCQWSSLMDSVERLVQGAAVSQLITPRETEFDADGAYARIGSAGRDDLEDVLSVLDEDPENDDLDGIDPGFHD